MQGVHATLGCNVAPRGHQRLSHDLPAVDALVVRVDGSTSEPVGIELFEVEKADEVIERTAHRDGP